MIARLASAAALLTALASPTLAETGFSAAATLQSLRGTFASSAPEPWHGGFGTREFVFADGQWSLIFTHALDPAMTQRTFRFRTGGPFRVTGPSATVAGAH
jgi:hypothetical protein